MDKKKINMKRILSALIGFPLVLIIFLFANNIGMDIAVSILSMICMYEYFKGFIQTKKYNPSSWLGYIICVLIAFESCVTKEIATGVMISIIPVSILVLATELVFSKGKKNIIDIAITIFGICYIPMMLSFLSFIRNVDGGKILIWYPIIAAWGSDIWAYIIGKHFGKHKYTEISPNKTIEGCVAGIIGALIMALIFTIVINNVYQAGIDYIAISIITAILSVIGQIGDLTASSIKRHCKIKDFGELIPGHGGMLDRFDSVIFIIPFAYISIIMFIL